MSSYVVVDIEADGPVPGPHSMLSLGAVAVSLKDGVLSEFEANLMPLEGALPHKATMDWFREHGLKHWLMPAGLRSHRPS